MSDGQVPSLVIHRAFGYHSVAHDFVPLLPPSGHSESPEMSLPPAQLKLADMSRFHERPFSFLLSPHFLFNLSMYTFSFFCPLLSIAHSLRVLLKTGNL